MSTPTELIMTVSLGRIEELAVEAGYIPLPETNAMAMLVNNQSNVMFLRFAYLIAKELSPKPTLESAEHNYPNGLIF